MMEGWCCSIGSGASMLISSLWLEHSYVKSLLACMILIQPGAHSLSNFISLSTPTASSSAGGRVLAAEGIQQGEP
jgi:hypothetical protein